MKVFALGLQEATHHYTTSTTFTYESLPGNTEFDVRVQAESDEGRGAWSEISKFSTSGS